MHDRSNRPLLKGLRIALAAAAAIVGTARAESAEPPVIRVVPISQELGLFEVAVTGDNLQASTIEVRDAQGRLRMQVPLAPSQGLPQPRNADPRTLQARILLSRDISVADRDGLTLRFGTQAEVPLTLVLGSGLSSPAWALGATWYQIFPERFRNGDRNNDPRGPEVVTVPWISDFTDVTLEEIELAWSRQRAGDRRTSQIWNRGGGSRRATIYARRYGGDLQGVHQALDHIASIGVTAIYFCPVFASSSLHKYDARDFRHIDPTFGPVPAQPELEDTWEWTAADRYFLDTILPAAKERGLRVILDGVWNHTGTDFWAFRDIQANGAESKYASWFRTRYSDSGRLVGWDAWDARNGNLPEFVQTPEGDLVPGVSEHVFRVTSRWMDPNGDGDPSDGIDGWRLDVAPEIGHTFWAKWRAHVRNINPDAVLIGEIWFDAEPWFNGAAFDAQMNYPFATAIVEWVAGAPRSTSQATSERLTRVFSHAPHTELTQMNLLASHDTTRILTMLARPNATYDDGATMVDLGRDSARVRPSEDISRRAIMAVALQVTMPGSPMIFAGDEFGVFGPDDPDNRKPIQWPDQPSPANPDDAPDQAILRGFREWLPMRSHPRAGQTLCYGTIRFLDTRNDDALAFLRELNGERLLIVANRGPSDFDPGDLRDREGHALMVDSFSARVSPLSVRWFTLPPPGWRSSEDR